MDEQRLKQFRQALFGMTRGVVTEARWEDRICVDLGLVHSQAMDVVVRFFTFCGDLLDYMSDGFIVAPPANWAGKYRELTCRVPISFDGVEKLLRAIHEGMFVEFQIDEQTTVEDVIDFVKGVELMEVVSPCAYQLAS